MNTKTILFAAVLLTSHTSHISHLFAQPPNLPGAGNCLSFNGTSDYVEVADNNNLDFGTNDFSVALWIKINSSVSNRSLIGKRLVCNGTTMWDIRISPSGDVQFETWESSPSIGGSTGASLIANNKWTHIVCLRNGINLRIYINGELKGSTTTSGIANISNSSNLNIAKDPCEGLDGTIKFNGSIDEVRIWNRALTQTEIRDNMCQKLVGNETGLVGYWRFDESSGTTANDSQINVSPNNGTLK